jgi:hypothetical protein
MAIEQDFDVLESIAELAHAVADRGNGRFKSAVNQDMAVARRDSAVPGPSRLGRSRFYYRLWIFFESSSLLPTLLGKGNQGDTD